MAQLGKRRVNHITYFLRQHFLIIATENKDTKTVQRIFDLSNKQRLRRVDKIFTKYRNDNGIN